ncbi:unnamed protein product [Hydatigera taeniaeformis]|uniref:MAGUK p55 subfamily member 4-like n=1 Tax=Hydatigena taeniaeformis TaxID=6205 RepID=A0A0R3WNB2_HYDTA|nr:unnamed protein product [Hydatigera taeniaeformis]
MLRLDLANKRNARPLWFFLLLKVRQLSEQQDVEHPSKDGHQLLSPSDSLPLSTAWDLTQASSYTPPLSPPHHRSPIPESPRKIPKSSPPHHSPGSRVGGAGPKHPALPSYVENSLPEPGMLRTIYIHRTSPEEPLGITLSIYDSSQMPIRSGSLLSLLGKQIQRGTTKDPPKIIIQRIIVGSLADKEGKLFPGDELIELNGVTATSLEAVQKAMFSATHKNVLQMVVKTPGIGQLKAYILSRHDPEHKADTLLPNANLGVSFKSGDVLELVDSQDLNWWQVRRLDTPNSPVGLVPSQTLQERRQAFNQQARTVNTMKKIKEVKSVFRAADSSNLLVRSDLWVYEEVVPWPPSPIPTLLLIGPNGVGRRTIKFLLCTQFPQRFAFPISDTTDSTATPALFRIRTKEDMENDIRQGAYVEWGTVDGHHYGIRFAAIREIIATGRTALIDCQCQSVYLLHQPEFNPHVVFVSAPKYEIAKAMMDAGIRKNLTINKRTSEEIHKIVEESKVFASQNQHLYAHTLVNSNMAESVEKLSQLVARLERQPGWIPAGWAYEMGLPRPLDIIMKLFVGKDGKREDRPSRLSIVGLPDDNRSVLSRVTSSMRSTASPESAVRLARPPSVCSSLQLPGTVVKGSCGIPPVGRWRYEKRNMVQPIQPPLSPLGSSTDQEIGSDNSTLPQPLPIERNLTSKTAVQSQAATRPAIGNPTSSKPPDLTKQQIFPHSGAKSNVRLKLSRGAIKANGGGGGDGNNANDDGDDDAISSTSSEDA